MEKEREKKGGRRDKSVEEEREEGRKIYFLGETIRSPRPRGRARNTWARYFTLVGEDDPKTDC